MCDILGTADFRAKRMKFGIRSPVNYITLCRLLLMSDSLKVYMHVRN